MFLFVLIVYVGFVSFVNNILKFITCETLANIVIYDRYKNAKLLYNLHSRNI